MRRTIPTALTMSLGGLGILGLPVVASADDAGPPASPPPSSAAAPPPPAWVARIGPPPKRRSEGRMIAGIVITSLASAVLVPGMVVTSIGIYGQTRWPTDAEGGPGYVTGLGALIIGCSGALAAIGIPLWVTGARTQKPVDPPWASAIPTIAGGPKTVGLRWTF